jgi:hypothetical protein
MKSETRSRVAAVAALTLALSGGLVAGCGGDSDGGGPWDAFTGRWFQVAPDPVADPFGTGFTLTCTDPVFSSLGGQILIWGSLVFEHGVLTDLAETSGNCSPLNYDINGKTATVPSPDPYLDSDPGCVIPFTLTNTAGTPLAAFFILTPGAGAAWSFQLLDTKTTGGAPQGRLVGSAAAHIIVEDGTESTPDCTYAGMDTFFRLTQP